MGSLIRNIFIPFVFLTLYLPFGFASQVSRFELAPKLDCVSAQIDPSYCVAAEPQEWTLKEKTQVLKLLSSLQRPEFKNFYEQIHRGGYTKIYRMKSLPKSLGNSKYSKDPSPATVVAWVTPRYKFIVLGDRFFEPRNVSASVAIISRKDKVLLHEFAHAFDFSLGKISMGPSFSDLLGWKYENEKWFLNSVPPTELRTAMDQYVSLVKSREYERAYQLNRSFGVSRGMPTLYSLSAPMECFAELVAFTYLDPQIGRYLDKLTIQWIRRTVEAKR